MRPAVLYQVLFAQAQLVLRLRDDDAELVAAVKAAPERLVVLRDEGGLGVKSDLADGAISIIELPTNEGGGFGLAFPITRLGAYVVAFERPR